MADRRGGNRRPAPPPARARRVARRPSSPSPRIPAASGPVWVDAWRQAFDDPARPGGDRPGRARDGRLAARLGRLLLRIRPVPALGPSGSWPARAAWPGTTSPSAARPWTCSDRARSTRPRCAAWLADGGGLVLTAPARPDHVRRYGASEAIGDRLRFGLEYGRLRAGPQPAIASAPRPRRRARHPRWSRSRGWRRSFASRRRDPGTVRRMPADHPGAAVGLERRRVAGLADGTLPSVVRVQTTWKSGPTATRDRLPWPRRHKQRCTTRATRRLSGPKCARSAPGRPGADDRAVTEGASREQSFPFAVGRAYGWPGSRSLASSGRKEPSSGAGGSRRPRPGRAARAPG